MMRTVVRTAATLASAVILAGCGAMAPDQPTPATTPARTMVTLPATTATVTLPATTMAVVTEPAAPVTATVTAAPVTVTETAAPVTVTSTEYPADVQVTEWAPAATVTSTRTPAPVTEYRDAAPTMAPCIYEDGSAPGQTFPCEWNAATMGNGRGNSFILTEAL